MRFKSVQFPVRERVQQCKPTTALFKEVSITSKRRNIEMNEKHLPVTDKKTRRFEAQLELFVIVLILMSLCPLFVVAQPQDGHSHTADAQSQQQGALIKAVQDATARYQNVRAAENDGYHLEFGCVSGSDSGAMGLHYVNDALVANGVVDVSRPQIVLYEAQPNGSLKLTGADYLVLAQPWDTKHPGTTPMLMGQIFHYFEAPNRFGLPAFYTLHVWAWKANPNGAFVNWHPDVNCQTFTGQTTP
jgi:hypothetical protein